RSFVCPRECRFCRCENRRECGGNRPCVSEYLNPYGGCEREEIILPVTLQGARCQGPNSGCQDCHTLVRGRFSEPSPRSCRCDSGAVGPGGGKSRKRCSSDIAPRC